MMKIWIASMTQPHGVNEDGTTVAMVQPVIVFAPGEDLARRMLLQHTKEPLDKLYDFRIETLTSMDFEIEWHPDLFFSVTGPIPTPVSE
jgi:hypothetical protein